jgi:hypothetical protein
MCDQYRPCPPAHARTRTYTALAFPTLQLHSDPFLVRPSAAHPRSHRNKEAQTLSVPRWRPCLLRRTNSIAAMYPYN